MGTVILDYGAGNLTSMRLALEHVGAEPVVVASADAMPPRAARIVFPGVGSAAACMANLRARGFDRVLWDAFTRDTPVLAVCIGMQLLFESSEEDGGVAALGILPGTVRRFAFPDGAAEKVPHMGWNRVAAVAHHPLWGDRCFATPEAAAAAGGDPSGEAFYFVHSYHAVPAWDAGGRVATRAAARTEPAGADAPRTTPRVLGATGYGGTSFASAVGAGSFFAAQFHPERSGEVGLALLRRFVSWDGSPC